MLEAAGGGGGTNWWGMSMEVIHSLSQSPDVDAHYQIVDGWQKSSELLGDHISQVQDYRNALAAAWPPQKSTAAATYLARLDGLLKSLNETYEATLANRDAMSSASLSLSLAKTEMAKIYSEWDTNNKAMAAFDQKQALKKQQIQTGKPLPSPSPSGDESPPVSASQQEALRQKAITLMSGVSSDLAQAQLKVVRPAPYQPAHFIDKSTGSSGPGSTSVPVLPPIVPTSYSGSGGGVSGGTPHFPVHAGAAFPATTNSSPPGNSGGNPGLVLGATNPLPTPPPVTSPGPITGLPTGTGPMPGPGPLPPATGPFNPIGTPDPTPIGGFRGEGGSFKPLNGLPEGGIRSMPPGGIIGKMPSGALGEPGVTRFGPQRVNPIGGVIGESRPGGGLGGQSMMGSSSGARSGIAARSAQAGVRGTVSQQGYGQPSGRRAGRRDEAEGVHWDPDNPWATEVGVDPVLLPAVEQRVDPGPAIGLS